MPTGPLISIVDDDLSIRRALRRLVQSASYAVQTFGSAREFLDASHSARPACLVLDFCLGGMSGFDLHERLAVDGSGIPVIFITAHDDAMTAERVRHSGVAAYLRKPFDGQVLLDAIESAVRPAPGRPS
jgi:FixJ family two-component response regulator